MIAKESPLKGMNTGTVKTVSIRELPGIPAIDLRVAPGTAAQSTVIKSLGIKLPVKTGQSWIASVGDSYVLCLAPDWWLIVGITGVEGKAAHLPLDEQHHFSVVDVSDQRTTIEVEDANARAVLAHLWDQDLRDKSFPVGSISQGLMARAPVILFHTAPSRYRIMVRSSFALHLWNALTDAAVEWV